MRVQDSLENVLILEILAAVVPVRKLPNAGNRCENKPPLLAKTEPKVRSRQLVQHVAMGLIRALDLHHFQNLFGVQQYTCHSNKGRTTVLAAVQLIATSDYNARRAIIQKYGYSSQFAIWFLEEPFLNHWTLNGWGNIYRINMDRRKALKEQEAANKEVLQV